MSLLHLLDVAGSAMKAQSLRLNTVASNLSNANNVAENKDSVYRPKMPVFKTGESNAFDAFDDVLNQASSGVAVDRIYQSTAEPRQEYRPGHPFADKQGYVYLPNINPVEEMANMISASRSYELNVHVADTAKQMIMQVLKLGE